jgi:hypothetical protein
MPVLYDVAERLLPRTEAGVQRMDVSELMSRAALEGIGRTVLGHSFFERESGGGKAYLDAVKDLMCAVSSSKLTFTQCTNFGGGSETNVILALARAASAHPLAHWHAVVQTASRRAHPHRVCAKGKAYVGCHVQHSKGHIASKTERRRR